MPVPRILVYNGARVNTYQRFIEITYKTYFVLRKFN
jgi:hypothetical protein